MAMIPEPPVNKMSPRDEIEGWIEELEQLRSDEALQDDETQRELRAHLNDARTWLRWDLYRRIMEDGEELTSALEEVGAFTRQPGDPPPEGEAAASDPAGD